jgi:hypothetical protein
VDQLVARMPIMLFGDAAIFGKVIDADDLMAAA